MIRDGCDGYDMMGIIDISRNTSVLYIHIYIHIFQYDLVGGLNPSEKYESQLG